MFVYRKNYISIYVVKYTLHFKHTLATMEISSFLPRFCRPNKLSSRQLINFQFQIILANYAPPIDIYTPSQSWVNCVRVTHTVVWYSLFKQVDNTERLPIILCVFSHFLSVQNQLSDEYLHCIDNVTGFHCWINWDIKQCC